MLRECTIKNDIEEIISLVYELNNKPEHNCSSCPKELEKIKTKFLRMIDSTEDHILLYYENNTLTGVVGFNIDIEEKLGDCVGPFIKENYENVSMQFIQYAGKILSGFTINFYFNSRNKKQLELMRKVNGVDRGSEKRMVLKDLNATGLPPVKIMLLTDSYKKEFSQLHDMQFYDVYWDSKKILNTLNNWIIYIETCKDELAGYLVVSCNNAYKFYIQAIGVSEKYKGKGYGSRLLNQAIFDGFINKNVTSIELDVENNNYSAERLYLSKGFQVQTESQLFEVKFI